MKLWQLVLPSYEAICKGKNGRYMDLDFLLRNRSQLELYEQVYNNLIRTKQLVPIEEIIESDKRTIYNDVKGFTEIIPDRIKLSKAVYVMGFIAEKYDGIGVD